jgi:hypothetical protein
MEIACMLELARLLKREDSDEGRRKWLNAAYGDSALYPTLQNLIKSALDSDDAVVDSQKALNDQS